MKIRADAYSYSERPWESLGGYYDFYIGDNADYHLNTKFEGGPYLNPEPEFGDAWKLHQWNGNYYWPHGLEVFPNLEGRYLHIVSDYSSFTNDDLKHILCSLIVTGTRYVRNEPIESYILTMTQYESLTLSISHVVSQLTIGNQIEVDVRQKVGEELPFVSISRQETRAEVTIDVLD